MNKTIGNYLNQPHNDFPLDAETLAYIQANAQLCEVLGNICGDKTILTGCTLESGTTYSEGYIFLKTQDYPLGEILHFAGGNTSQGIYIDQQPIAVSAEGNQYPQAYTQRSLLAGLGNETFSWTDFSPLTTTATLKSLCDGLQTQISAMQATPVGAVLIWTSNTIPTNYALCNGNLLNKADYPILYSIIGDTYKLDTDGDLGNQFRLPDTQGRFIASNGPAYTLNETGGENSHTLTAAESGLPAHYHTTTFNTYDPSVYVDGDTQNRFARGKGDCEVYNINTTTTGGLSADFAHENRPPFIVLNYIIKVR